MRHFAGDLAPAALGVHQLERQVERAERDIEQPLHGGRNAADRIGDGRVAAPAVEPAAGVDADDVAFHERLDCSGMPWTTSSLTLVQVAAGNGGRPLF